MDFDAVPPLGLVELPPEPCCPLGSEMRSTNAKQIELFASFCRMVGDEGAGSGGSHWTQPDVDPRKVIGSTISSSSRNKDQGGVRHHDVE
jgi:hypothetical protein